MANNEYVLFENHIQRAMKCGQFAELLKKMARQLHQIVGVDVAVGVISENGKVYTEGHPSMDQVWLRMGYENINENPMVKFRRDHEELYHVVMGADESQFLALEILATNAIHAISAAEQVHAIDAAEQQ